MARALLRRGQRVRGLTRRIDSPAAQELSRLGAEMVVGDFEDVASLTRVAQGMDTIFAMTTFVEGGPEAETQHGVNIVEAAEAAGAEHFIYSSVSDADRNTGIHHFESKFEVEKHIQERGIPSTIVAPVFLMENLLGPWHLPALQQGSFALPMPPGRNLQHVALEDAAAFEVLVVENRERFLGKRVNIASDELTGAEVAAVLSRITSREIRFDEVSIDPIREASEDAALMYEWFVRVGYSADISALRRDFPEVGWHTFEKWAGSQDWSILGKRTR